jgi:3-oxoacyl-[acyl-carrier protein] reductase
MSSALNGRVALVTGVSRPVGIATRVAQRLHDMGATVFATGHSPHDAGMPWGVQPLGTSPFAVHSHDLEFASTPAALIDEVAACGQVIDSEGGFRRSG